MSGNEFVEITVDYLHHTRSAVSVSDADGREAWLPLSTVRFDGDFDRLQRRQSITLEAQEWIAKRNGLI
jgi:hypothetical protein